MTVPCFLVSRICASVTGAVNFNAVAIDRAHDAAVHIAFERQRQDVGIYLVGDPGLRNVDVILPDDIQSLRLGKSRTLAARIAHWIEALRAHGELTLANLMVGRDGQSVSAEWLTDPVVLACLGVVLSPAPPYPNPYAPDPQDWLDMAPGNSVGGLLRQSPYAREFVRWLERVPESCRSLLCIPLYAVNSDDTACLRIGCWLQRNHRHPFLAGEVCQLDIDASGAVWPFLRPVRADEGWQLIDPRMTLIPDPAWQHSGDLRLDRLFARLPKMAESLLLDGAGAAIHAGVHPQLALDMLPALNRWLEHSLSDLTAPLTEKLLGHAHLTGVPGPRLAHARYMQGDGDTECASRRQQIIALWPALVNDLTDLQAMSACNAIYAGRPLIPALALDFHVPAWAIRRVLQLLRGTTSKVGDFPELARLVAAAGPHAPAITCSDLPALASLRRLVPQQLRGPSSIVLMRALGREAELSGWDEVARLLDRPDIHDECDNLVAWWDDLRHNVRDVLERTCSQTIDAEDVERTFTAWTSGMTFSSALKMARGWHNLLWDRLQEEDDLPIGEFHVPALFGTFSMIHSRVQVSPLTSPGLLREEGQRMRHCVASYWRAVASGRRIVLSLLCSASGERATVAWAYRPGGGWSQGAAASECNAPIPPDSRIMIALGEIASLLAEEEQLQPEALALHRHAAQELPPRAADFAIDGGCLVSALPPPLARAAMCWLPGAGTIDRRVLHAATRASGILLAR